MFTLHSYSPDVLDLSFILRACLKGGLFAQASFGWKRNCSFSSAFPARVTAVINYRTPLVHVCSGVSFVTRLSPSTPTMNLNLIPKHSPSITSVRSTRDGRRGKRKGLELICPQELPKGIIAHSREFEGGGRGGGGGMKRRGSL